MPNHCENTLTVTGAPGDVQAFRDFAMNGDEKPFDINKFVPMPDEIRQSESPNPEPELAARLIKEHGAANWYDWACDNWGTKWEPYEVNLKENTTQHPDQSSLCYWFLTAWAPFSDDCMEKISARFPTLKLHLEYSESGMGFEGYYTLEAGRFIDSKHTEIEDKDGEE